MLVHKFGSERPDEVRFLERSSSLERGFFDDGKGTNDLCGLDRSFTVVLRAVPFNTKFKGVKNPPLTALRVLGVLGAFIWHGVSLH